MEDTTWCWHRRFGHLNLQSLKLLQQKDMVYGLPEIGNAESICQACAIGKAHREAFGEEEMCGDQVCHWSWSERQLTVAYSPQQNGVADRKNRTIAEISKAMINEEKLPYMFWGETVNTAVYIQNRCPTKALNNTTPFEAFSGRMPGIKHLRVFGSICFCHVPRQLRSKLADSAVKSIFVGYGKCEKGYRVYNRQTKKITISRNVIFDEGALWDWDKQTIEYITIPMNFEDNSRSIEEEYEVTASSTLATQLENISSSVEMITDALNADSSDESPSSTPVKLRDITEIYARCNMSIIEPESFTEASRDKAWNKAMKIEMEIIEKNGT
ncbi:hypothetical protein L3X38_018328 [Prunus dulcis]|uniref:Integrase catalytic domain-containing protein n=1 Tax=Prunus dulcis TaxID=3755 RepID=A0AAD4W9I2_PRUDU|nr:hypothetical protein L3X38_018328 [Prunus dulcis]